LINELGKLSLIVRYMWDEGLNWGQKSGIYAIYAENRLKSVVFCRD